MKYHKIGKMKEHYWHGEGFQEDVIEKLNEIIDYLNTQMKLKKSSNNRRTFPQKVNKLLITTFEEE